MKLTSFPRTWFFRTGLILVLGIAGCGGKETFPVKGKVVYEDGSDISVLKGGVVRFDLADPDATPAGAQGEIQADGSFQMSTTREGDGVLPGKYRVLISPPYKGVIRDGVRPPPVLDEVFRDFETSGLEITVPGGDYTLKVRK